MPRKYVIRKEKSAPGSPGFRIKYEDELNEAQHDAVTHLKGPLLVIAGAGSGKTRTLVYRVARLVESGVPPENLLLLTFTRRAAQEMLRRAELLVRQDCGEVAGGTFHSFAHRMLRRHGKQVGVSRDFTILDRTDSQDVIQMLRVEMGLHRRDRRFPKKATISEIFSRASNRGELVAEVLASDHPHFLDHTEDLEKLGKRYGDYKETHHLLDYDDLLERFDRLLRESKETRSRLAGRYRYIMVDEYQDTNRLQSSITSQLALAHGNVMVVGDDSQSIYSFRGARFENIIRFPDEFPSARVITMEENYRSTASILDFTNAVISQATVGYPKRLFTHRPKGGMPVLIRAPDSATEARFVAQRVLELREEGHDLRKIAVLFRSAFQSYELELELARRDIPYVKYGGFKFLETAHIKDVVAHIRVLANPLDAVSWHRLLLLVDGVGPATATALVSKLLSSGSTAPLRAEAAGKRAKAGLARLAQLLESLGRTGEQPQTLVEWVIDYYQPLLESRYDDHPRRKRDLDHFRILTQRYNDLESLLSDLALEPPDRSAGKTLAVDTENEQLILSTVHSAKGLEWSVVFVIGLLDGHFPSYRNLMGTDELEEERRLLYVAATRARDSLYLTYPVSVYHPATGEVLHSPSRFLDGLPEELLERWELYEESGE